MKDYRNIIIDEDETNGKDDFKSERAPDVCAVVVDKGSGKGFVQITGGDKDTKIIYTGRGDTACERADISTGQTCMLYGTPTVLYARPSRKTSS